jgi:hypothetical protein
MLSDEQVDELERVIFGSTIDDLPMILGKALPLLFAELRIVRATLDSKVSRFLEVPNVTSRDASTGGSGQLVPVGNEPEGCVAGDAGEASVSKPADATSTHVGVRQQEEAGESSDTGGVKAEDTGSEKSVATRGRKPKVGGPRKQKRDNSRASVSDDLADDLPSLK